MNSESFCTLTFCLASLASVAPARAPTVPVNPDLFIKESLTTPIIQETRRLADGTAALCDVITTKSRPQEHEMGPWSPRHITDEKDQSGIWFKDGEVYDVDGAFVANLAEFYGDPTWNLVREDGTIRVTDTKEAFKSAARPHGDPRDHYHVGPAGENEIIRAFRGPPGTTRSRPESPAPSREFPLIDQS